MQNRYAGDIGDFGKYGLLRALYGRPGDPTLGMVWYLNGNESHNNDGRFTRYLEPTRTNLERFRACDPNLYEALDQIVNTGQRSVEAVRNKGILPASTRWFAQRVDPVPRTRGTGTHLQQRQAWLEEAVMDTLNCQAIFLDPDNGLSSPGTKPTPKHATLEEVARFAGSGRSVIIYHHIGRQGTAEDQARAQLARLGDALERPGLALLYHRRECPDLPGIPRNPRPAETAGPAQSLPEHRLAQTLQYRRRTAHSTGITAPVDPYTGIPVDPSTRTPGPPR